MTLLMVLGFQYKYVDRMSRSRTGRKKGIYRFTSIVFNISIGLSSGYISYYNTMVGLIFSIDARSNLLHLLCRLKCHVQKFQIDKQSITELKHSGCLTRLCVQISSRGLIYGVIILGADYSTWSSLVISIETKHYTCVCIKNILKIL